MRNQAFTLPPELMEYLHRRAIRTGKTLQQTLESMVSEAQAYDDLVSEMERLGLESMQARLRKPLS